MCPYGSNQQLVHIYWLGTNQATRHYLNQWWLVYWCIHASLSHNELKGEKLAWISSTVGGLFDSHMVYNRPSSPKKARCMVCFVSSGGRFKNTYELLNLRALKISKLHKNHIFQCMGKIFCVEFQRVPLKFHTKYLTHTLKDVDFIHIWKFKSSLI